MVTCIAALIRIPMDVDERRRMRPKMSPRSRLGLDGRDASGQIGDGYKGVAVFPGGEGTQPKGLAFLRLCGSGLTTARAEQATTDYQAH
jgi:hypothetical protein